MKAVWAAALALWAGAAGAEPVVYTGAKVWTGTGWDVRDIAIDGDRIVADASSVATRIDVAGKFITPPYGNAHAHVTNATPEASRFYTDAGVFYIWNPNTVVIGPTSRAFFTRADTYDVKVAQGGITEPGSHPEPLYVEVLASRVYGGRGREWFIGNAFHYGATPAEIDAALALLQEQGAEFVKTYLLGSERYEAGRRGKGGHGINPVNMPYLVSRAHARGLKVAVHVETTHDLRMAAWADADVAAHLPGYSGGPSLDETRIDDPVAQLVAKSGMAVVPTYALFRQQAYPDGAREPKPEALPLLRQQMENIRTLRAAGVPIWIGTDGDGPVWSEAEHLVEIGAMTPEETTQEVLATGARLFPERRVGCLQVGCEADFLVLDADPILDITNLRRIGRRVMQGRELPAPQPVP